MSLISHTTYSSVFVFGNTQRVYDDDDDHEGEQEELAVDSNKSGEQPELTFEQVKPISSQHYGPSHECN